MENRIKMLRKALDLTQTEFAKRIGSVQNTITGYESGRRTPSSQVVSLICREFGVNERWLRYGEGEMFAPQAENELEAVAKKYGLTFKEQALVKKFVTLDDDGRAAVLKYLEGIVEILSMKPPAKEEDDIEEKVEEYRRQLLEEKKAAGGSSALTPDGSENDAAG